MSSSIQQAHRRRRVGPLLVGAGLVLVVLALAANTLALGSSGEFGWKQALLLAIGAVTAAVGVYRVRLESPGIADRVRALSIRAGYWHAAVALAVVAVAVLAFENVFETRPFDLDNLVVLTRGSVGNPLELWTSAVDDLNPAYRPLAYSTVWAQYQLWDVDVRPYLIANLAIWCACLAVGYRFLLERGLAAPLAGVFVVAALVDFRVDSAIYWVGARTVTLAALFGFLALIVAYRAGPETNWRRTGPLLAALLVAAAVCKEYGLAASAAVLAVGLISRGGHGKRLALVAIGAVGAYVLLRLAAVGLGTGGYCEYMGLWRDTREVCFGEARGEAELLTGAERLEQMVYNAGATFVGTMLPFLFDASGAIATATERSVEWDAFEIGFYVALLLAAITAWVRTPRVALPLFVLLAANSVLNFAIYRTRDQLLGAIALYLSAALGMRIWLGWLRSAWPRRALAAAAVVVAAIWVTTQVGERSDHMTAYVKEANATKPCPSIDDRRQIGISDELVRDVRVHYGLPVACEPNPDRLD